MLDNLLLATGGQRSIALVTRLGTPISNAIEVEPSPGCLRKFDTLVRKHAGWKVRKPPTGGYNCAGHVWASRRTSITEDFETQVARILQDDGYRKLEPGQQPTWGDIVLYWDKSRRFLYHVGVVTELADGFTPDSPRQPWVLSKFDGTSGEVLHLFSQVPFEDWIHEYWTDRP